MRRLIGYALSVLAIAACQATPISTRDTPQTSPTSSSGKPNIVFIIADDIGYGDISAHGNPAIQTPAIDQLNSESIRFTDFHVDPMCSMTRAALMTGQHSVATGVLHTVMARNILPAEHVTMAEVLKENGYTTGLFGKWHLGDNYPFRPQDQGFDRVVMPGGGGVGQTWDYWGNTQFGDTYWVDGEPTPFAGYANDVWFDEAEKFIEQAHREDKPFFTYIPTGNPHGPWRAPHETIQPYLEAGLPPILARFYAMITEVDMRIAKLRTKLEQMGIADNTLFIFTSDNGSALSDQRIIENSELNSQDELFALYPEWQAGGFNAGLRESKASVYEGGHRVPFLLYWPQGDIGEAREIDAMTAQYDLLPTFIDLLELETPEPIKTDGVSWKHLLLKNNAPEERSIIVVNQNRRSPDPTRPTVFMTDKWRYFPNSGELYNIENDWSQKHDVSAKHPEIVATLDTAYRKQWQDISSRTPDLQRPIFGHEAEPEMRLTVIDQALPEGDTILDMLPWNPGTANLAWSHDSPGWVGRETLVPIYEWQAAAASTATYKFDLYFHDKPAIEDIPFTYAHLKIGNQIDTQKIGRDAISVHFERDIAQGPTSIRAWFSNNADPQADGTKSNAFYLYVSKK